jgi:hypothetical protein
MTATFIVISVVVVVIMVIISAITSVIIVYKLSYINIINVMILIIINIIVIIASSSRSFSTIMSITACIITSTAGNNQNARSNALLIPFLVFFSLLISSLLLASWLV